MRIKALVLILIATLVPTYSVHAQDVVPKVAVAYDIGFLGDNSYNDAVHAALEIAKKKYRLVEPFVREVPTNGTVVDRLTRLRFLAKNGYTLIITVGSGYRDIVRRVAIEYPETQFALINDKSLSQMNISNIYFNEEDAAFLAGVLAAHITKRKIAFIGDSDMISEAFLAGAKRVKPKIKPVVLTYTGDIKTLSEQLVGVDIVYSLWDKDATVFQYTTTQKIGYIARKPDQYFSSIKNAQGTIVATLTKNLTTPLSDLVSAALANSAIIDVLDEGNSIYGREYNASNGGLAIQLNSSAAKSAQPAIRSALSFLAKKR